MSRRRKGAAFLAALLVGCLLAGCGEQAASLLLYTPESADAVSFEANGGAVILDVEKYGLDIAG